MSKEKNRGTGAGGANTNKNGLDFESKTELDEYIEIHGEESFIFGNSRVILNQLSFKSDDSNMWFKGNKSSFYPFMDQILGLPYVKKNGSSTSFNGINIMHGCKQPDDYYINIEKGKIIIIEKKTQNGGGSVIEKLQTAKTKLDHFHDLFDGFEINYIYLLSPWCRCGAIAELDFLRRVKVPYYFSDSENYKEKIVEEITRFANRV